MLDPILEYLTDHRREMVGELQTFVEQESPSLDKALLDRTAEWLRTVLEGAGAAVEMVPQTKTGNHLIARWPGQVEAEPLLLLCHYDTVFPEGTLARRPFLVNEGRVRGPGVFDMKTGYIQALWAIRSLFAAGEGPRRPLVLVSNSDEEIGSGSSRALIEEETRKARAVLVFEASQDGKVKTGRKGTAFYHLEIEGRAAHAGLEPERGVSAIVELATQIQVVGSLADVARGTTVNVGTVRGGTRSNVIAAQAEADIDVRFAEAGEAERVDRAMCALSPYLPGSLIRVTGGKSRPPLERSEGVLELFSRAHAVAERLGFPLGEAQVGGSSDGNFSAALGVPVLDGLGAVGDGAHADHEFADLVSMPLRAALAAHLMAEL